MQAQEVSRKSGFFKKAYGLSISIAPESQEHFMQELRLVKEALVNWKGKRGSSCETVMLVVVSEPDLHEFAKEIFAQIYTDEADLSPILKSTKVLVGLLDKSGNPLTEYELH